MGKWRCHVFHFRHQATEPLLTGRLFYFPPDRNSARFLRLPLDTVILQVVQPSHAETSQSETERNENPLRALGEEESPGCAEENPLPGGPQVTAHGFGCEEEGLDGMTVCTECKEETMPGELCYECDKCLSCCECHVDEPSRKNYVSPVAAKRKG